MDKIILFLATAIVGCANVCHSQGIFFSIKDPESNQIITQERRSVTLVCDWAKGPNAEIGIHGRPTSVVVITHHEGSVDTARKYFIYGPNTCFEYTIPYLRGIAIDYAFTCAVTFKVHGGELRLEKTFEFDLASDDQRCFRNGTSGEPFGLGDIVSMTCYCSSDIERDSDCYWMGYDLDDEISFYPRNEKQRSEDGRVITWVTIGPLTPEQTNIRYECKYGPPASDNGTGSCFVGPARASIDDLVINPVYLSNVTNACPEPATAFPVTSAPTTYETVTSTAAPRSPGSPIVYVIVVGVATLLLGLLTGICIMTTIRKTIEDGRKYMREDP